MEPIPPHPPRVVTVSVPEDSNGEELTVPHALADRLRLVVHQGYDLILLDVSRLTHCNSMTLGAIVQTYVSAVKNGGSLKLLNVRRRFRDLLAVTKIDKVIQIAEMDEGTSSSREVVDPEGTEIRGKAQT